MLVGGARLLKYEEEPDLHQNDPHWFPSVTVSCHLFAEGSEAELEHGGPAGAAAASHRLRQ